MTERNLVRVWIDAGGPIAAAWFADVLPRSVAACTLHGDPAKLVILDSDRFPALDAADNLATYLDPVLERMNALARVHFLGHLEQRFTIHKVEGSRWNSRRTFRLKVVPSTTPESRASASQTFLLAESDEPVAHALRLLRDPVIGWHGVYDVITFLQRQGFVSPKSAEIVRHRQTANYYRHLGDPRQYQLPNDAPTIVQSRAFILGHLSVWLTERTAADAGTHAQGSDLSSRE